MIKTFTANANKTEYFCQKYWQNVLKKHPVRQDHHSYLHDTLPLHLLNIDIICNRTRSCHTLEAAKKIYKSADLEFRQTKPVGKSLTFWRGISHPRYNAISIGHPIQMNLYNKCMNLEKGDVLYMKEYAFATTSKVLARDYMGENGILYKIKVDKNTKMLYGDIHRGIFPRASKFLCTGIKYKKNKYTKYKQINLKLLPSNFEPKVENKSYIEKIKDFGLQKFEAKLEEDHAYAINKMTDDYVYLTDSNHPDRSVKVSKNTFMEHFAAVLWEF